ncbi:MAG: hypothetical protein C0598_02670 [Marinilabiliales bacterium]|nr:MAG: hypothetical protein C0598_02670 [Marinilabiliales bacterium]
MEVLEYFKHKKMAILSNKFDHFTKQMAQDYEINKYFDLVLGANDNMKKKPSAEPINYILGQTEVDREFAIMIGDSEQDIMTAKNAGIKSIGLTYGYRTKEQLSIVKPNCICDNILKIKDLIE